jgi:hypothetical protein
MEQIPNWLTDAVAAAGMTAYADGGLEQPTAAKCAPTPSQIVIAEPVVPPLH